MKLTAKDRTEANHDIKAQGVLNKSKRKRILKAMLKQFNKDQNR
jgi:hypothetical protein